MRFARDASDPGLFDAVLAAFDDLAIAAPDRARDVTLGGAWRVLSELGVAPTIDNCAECHSRCRAGSAGDVQPSGGRRAVPAVRASGAQRTNAAGRGARRASRLARRTSRIRCPTCRTARAHQRLLREFVREHLADDRPLRAFDVWERDALSARVAGEPA